MPTIAGLKRAGAPAAIREFVKRIGVAKANSVVDVRHAGVLHSRTPQQDALRRMAVLRPLRIVIENYPEGQTEEIEAVNHPDDPAAGTAASRSAASSTSSARFHGKSPKKFFRLSPAPKCAALRLFHQVH